MGEFAARTLHGLEVKDWLRFISDPICQLLFELESELHVGQDKIEDMISIFWDARTTFRALIDVQSDGHSFVALCNQTIVVTLDDPGFAIIGVLLCGIAGGFLGQSTTLAARRHYHWAGLVFIASILSMAHHATSVSAALAEFGAWLGAGLDSRSKTLSRMARLDTLVVAIEALATDLSTGWV